MKSHHQAQQRGFSLMEVMIAIGIFFMCIFVVLSMVSSSLQNARRLQRPMVDASPLLARYAATNILIEGHYHGDLGEPDLLGKGYQNFTYDGDIVEVETNRFFSIDFKILSASGGNEVVSHLGTVIYAPNSPAGSLDGATVAKRR